VTDGERLIWAAAFADWLSRMFSHPPNREFQYASHAADGCNAALYANAAVETFRLALKREVSSYPNGDVAKAMEEMSR
jgi:hypothetical protein